MDPVQLRRIKMERAKRRGLWAIPPSFLRLAEVLLVLLLIVKVYTYLPGFAKISTRSLKGLGVVLVGPGFLFVVGNAIVITLYVIYTRRHGRNSDPKGSNLDLYQEFLEKSEMKEGLLPGELHDGGRKQSQTATKDVHRYRRTQSEDFKRYLRREVTCLKLKRSKTEKHAERNINNEEKLTKSSYPEDRMSNDEFRSKIEAFIARQKKFLQDEENSSV